MATHSTVVPGESQGRGNLVGCRLWGRTESNTTEVTLSGSAVRFEEKSRMTPSVWPDKLEGK